MAVADRLRALLPPETARRIEGNRDRLTEVRLRAGRPIQLCWDGDGGELTPDCLDPQRLKRLLAALMEYSVYARQDELDRGFFTLADGSRVGVCGRMVREGVGVRMTEIGSACVRIARALPGSADGAMDLVAPSGNPRSALLVSPPGMGKTTLLRDIARQLSIMGWCVGVADERRELAACCQGVPTLDVGPRTDVMDGCPRAEAIGRMVRAMSPRVIVADEIGGPADALALAEAARCGVRVVASAHGEGLSDLRARADTRAVLDAGVLRCVIALGPRPGAVRGAWVRGAGEGDEAWRPA